MGTKHARSLIFGVFAALAVAVAGAEVFTLKDLAGGQNDSVPGNQIADNEAVSIVNFHVDPNSRGLRQRRGSSKRNATQLSGNVFVDPFSLVKSNGNAYLVAVASRTVYYSADNGSTWTSLITTATYNTPWSGVAFVDDNFYMVNQNDGGRQFTGSAFPTAGSMPSAKYIQAYQNRLFVGNTAANPYRLFFSGLLQPTTWTVTTDYIDLPEAITGIGAPFDGGLPVYTLNTTWMLRGSGPRGFDFQQISSNIGCADHRTIRNFIINGVEYQVFFSLGPNGSRRNFYGLNGGTLVDLGDKVPNLLDSVSIFDSSARILDWDTYADFALGTTSYTYASSAEEAVKLSTFTGSDTSASDFASGSSLVSVSTEITIGSISGAALFNEGFELGSGTTSYYWSLDLQELGTATDFTRLTGNQRTGTYSIKLDQSNICGTGGGEYDIYIKDFQGNTVSSLASQTEGAAYAQHTLSLSGSTGKLVRVQIDKNFFRASPFCPSGSWIHTFGGSDDSQYYSPWFVSDGGDVTYYAKIDSANSDFYFDDFYSANSSPTFTSRAFDTSLSSPAWIASGVSWTTNGNQISAFTQSSSDGSSWDAAVAWSTGSAPTSSSKRYVRYRIDFTTTTSGTAVPSVADATLSARQSSGTFTSEIRDGSTDLASWDNLNVLWTGGGSHRIFYRTNASSTSILSDPWVLTTTGTDIPGNNRYFQWRDDMSISVSTYDPTLTRVMENFTTSSGAQQPSASIVWNKDYWMSYTSTGSSKNDAIILMNNEGKFSKLTGLNVYGFTVGNQQLFGGDSITDGSTGGYLRQLDTSDTDDGTAISAAATLKHNEFGMEDYRKNLSISYFNYGVNVGTFTATILRNFGQTSNSYTVQFSTGNVIGRWKLLANPGTVGRQFGLQFSNSYTGSLLNIYPPITWHLEKVDLIQNDR